MKLCCISVDVDGIDHYQAIHGLPPSEPQLADLCHDLAVRRMLDWSQELGIVITWFVIGRDTHREDFVKLLKNACERGHEIANHSLDHRYDLVRLEPHAQREQIVGAQVRLEAAFGSRPLGFRAPGYTVSDELLRVVESEGYTYDSSVFPCAPYYLAKALVLAGQRLVGRHSMSILDRPGVLLAPTQPYRVGQPYTRRGTGVLEIPVQVSPLGRLPFIGTALSSLGPKGARLLARSLLRTPIVNIELHAIDWLTAADGLNDLGRYQPDLRLPLERKRAAFSEAIAVFRNAGYQFVTMLDAARRLEIDSERSLMVGAN